MPIFSSCSVPCLRRAASVEEEYEAAGGEVLLDNEDNDGWLATHGKPKGMLCLEISDIIFQVNQLPDLWNSHKILTHTVSHFVEGKSAEEENLPSMENLEISKNKAVKFTPSYFGGDDEEDIPDMADYEEPDNVIDPVSI